MSYKCEVCKKQIKKGIPQMKIHTNKGEEKKACPKCYKIQDEKNKSKKKK